MATATLQKPLMTLTPIFQTRRYRDELESTLYYSPILGYKYVAPATMLM